MRHSHGVSRRPAPAAEGTARSVPGPDGADPRRWRALGVSLVAAFMSLLDVSIVNVALPSIEHRLGASAGTAQWVVSGYALAFGLALVPAGRLGDTLGRRRMFLIALSAFVVTSALSGAAPTSGTAVLAMVFYRVLTSTGHDYPAAISDALLCASGLMVLALLVAVAELLRRRAHRLDESAPIPRPEHHLYQG
jgi:MFS family permease